MYWDLLAKCELRVFWLGLLEQYEVMYLLCEWWTYSLTLYLYTCNFIYIFRMSLLFIFVSLWFCTLEWWVKIIICVRDLQLFDFHTFTKSSWYQSFGFTTMVVCGCYVQEFKRDICALEMMKWDGKSSNSKSILNNMRIEIMMMMIGITLKLVPLPIIKRMLILSIIDHITMIVTILLLSIKEEWI